MNVKSYKVGDIVRPADGSNYRGKIIYVSKEQDVIKHQCLKTGKIYEKSYFGFFCRYCTLEEYNESIKINIEEYQEEISELKDRLSLDESESNYLKSLEHMLEKTINERDNQNE
jgi:membrane protease subunit (stomatin/prohibitin family)